MREEVKKYVANQTAIVKSWVMEWTEKGQQYMREDMELLKVEVQSMRKQAIQPHREDWSTSLERGWVIREESASERRKMADRENERVRELEMDRARMARRVEDLEKLVRELERKQRDAHTSEWNLETMFFQQRQKMERLEQRLETRAIKSKEECNAHLMEACEKRASGERQIHERLPGTKPTGAKRGESAAETEAQMMDKDKIVKEMELQVRKKDQLLKVMELQMREKDQIVKEMELKMKEKDQILKVMELQMREKDQMVKEMELKMLEKERTSKEVHMEMVEYKYMMMEKMEILEQKIKDAHAAQIMEREKQQATRSSMTSTATKADNEITDGEGRSSASSGTGSDCSRKRNGKNRKMADRGRAKTRSPAESNGDRAKVRRRHPSNTSADSDISSIGCTESRRSSEKSAAALGASELLDNSLDKTSVRSAASLAEAQAGKGKEGKFWKRAFGGLFKKTTK